MQDKPLIPIGRTWPEKLIHSTAMLMLVGLAPMGASAQTAGPEDAESVPTTDPQVRDQEGTLDKPSETIPPAEEGSLYDKIWDAMTFYENDENPVIQSFAFTGRFQADFAYVNQSDYDDLLIRRFRLGGKAQMFQDFTVHAEVDLAPEDSPVYQRLTDAYVAWSRHDNLQITVGKQSAPFTLDGATSSKRLLTIDRSNVANNMWFTQEYFPGVSLSGVPGAWRYHTAVYATGNDQREFGHMDGKVFVLGSLGYDFAENLDGVEEAILSGNYVYNWQDLGNASTRALEQVASLSFSYGHSNWGVRTEVTGAQGWSGQSDLWGTQLMPYYDVTEKLQTVARFTYVKSADPNGVRFARYENQVVPSGDLGDEYSEVYFGVNYYFYGHKLKVQTGVNYADMNDSANDGGAYSGWAWTMAFRLYW